MIFLRSVLAPSLPQSLFFSIMGDSDEDPALPTGQLLEPTISASIQSAVSRSISSLTDNLTQVIESRLADFSKRFSEENISNVEQAVKRARRENYTCKRKGNQQQLDHAFQVLDKFEEVSDALKSKSYEKAKEAVEAGTNLVSKRVKSIKLADKSDYGWATVNEYLSDDLASDSGDEKRMFVAEKRAERKVKNSKRRRGGKAGGFSGAASQSSKFPSAAAPPQGDDRPVRRLGPCFKISICSSSLTSFVHTSYYGLRDTQAIIHYSP